MRELLKPVSLFLTMGCGNPPSPHAHKLPHPVASGTLGPAGTPCAPQCPGGPGVWRPCPDPAAHPAWSEQGGALPCRTGQGAGLCQDEGLWGATLYPPSSFSPGLDSRLLRALTGLPSASSPPWGCLQSPGRPRCRPHCQTASLLSSGLGCPQELEE